MRFFFAVFFMVSDRKSCLRVMPTIGSTHNYSTFFPSPLLPWIQTFIKRRNNNKRNSVDVHVFSGQIGAAKNLVKRGNNRRCKQHGFVSFKSRVFSSMWSSSANTMYIYICTKYIQGVNKATISTVESQFFQSRNSVLLNNRIVLILQMILERFRISWKNAIRKNNFPKLMKIVLHFISPTIQFAILN